MGCCKPFSLNDEHKKVLSTLNASTEPLGNAQIAEISGLDKKIVTSRTKTLKTKGYIDSPASCKYAITDMGKKEV